jgi:glyoxylase-like metal-dependent hydrolase (beta-lactamase superfamily II)
VRGENEVDSEKRRLAAHGVTRVRAENPSPLTLSGTNTWVVGANPAWVIDPGPALASHIEALQQALEHRGGLGGIALTHDHPDHSEAIGLLRERMPARLAAGRGEAQVRLSDGCEFGPLRALFTPGHADDHFALICGPVCFTGDAVLGEGTAFIAPERGALAGYLNGLERLREQNLEVLCPGHGPAIWDVQKTLSQYIEHRLDRERRLLAGLSEGRRSVPELLDSAWSDVPAGLRAVAALTLTAHLWKLKEQGMLPDDVEWPSW